MKMLSLFCFLCLFLGQSLASPSSNQYVDTVIHTSFQNVIAREKLNRTHLPDYTFEYKDKTFVGKVGGKAEYSEGIVAGLANVQRYSECDGPRNISGSTIINCTLTFNNLETSYKGKVKYGVLPKVNINAKGNARYNIFNVGITKSFSDRNARVTSLLFRSFGSVTTNFTGFHWPLTKQMKVLEENYRTRVGAEVINVITTRFQYAFNLAVAAVPMPLR